MILNDSILIFILGFLTLSVALNLWLSFRLARTVRRLLAVTSNNTAPPLEAGTVISDISLERFVDQHPVMLSAYPNHAKALVFLSSGCDKCKAKLPGLRAAMEKTHDLGVVIWIISIEKRRRIKSFIGDEALLGATMLANKDTHDYLNPQSIFPYYLFIDADNTVQADGMIGDENWGNFMEQLEQGE